MNDYRTRGVIQPTPHDSAEQHMRWMLAAMHRYWWQQTGVKDVRSINQLTQDIRRDWIEKRAGK